MTRKNQLQRSGSRLQRQGLLFVSQTRKAGETFAEETMNASVTFGRELRVASVKLVSSLGRSTEGLQRALHKEALDWQALVLKTRDAYVAALKARLDKAERQAVTTREALKPEALQTTVLQTTQKLLAQAQSKVDAQLEEASKPAKAPTAAKRKAAKPKAAKPKAGAKPKAAPRAPAKKSDAPIRDYDQLSAKDVVSRVQRLSAPQASAVLDYERAKKKRATVIRAVEQRLAVAS